MDNILVSVVIPVYNVDRFVDKCLISVINQTYKNIEIIVIDDCSTDNSGAICDKYKYDNLNIKVIHKEINEGVSSARNIGINKAKGEYIFFLDGDDYIAQTMIEEVVATLIKSKKIDSKIDTVCFGYNILSEDNQILGKEKPILWPERIFIEEEIFDKFINTLFVSKNELEYFISHNESYYETIHKYKKMGTCWRFLLSKEVIDTNNLIFDDKVKRGEDLIFMTWYLQKCKGIANYNGEAYQYIQRNGSTMHSTVSLEKKMSFMIAQDTVSKYARNGRTEELINKWSGQRVLISMNTAREAIKNFKFIEGYKFFHKLAAHDISKKAYKNISLKNSKLKYRIAIGLLKCHMYFAFYLGIWILDKMHVNVSPMN